MYKMELTKEQVEWVLSMEENKSKLKNCEEDALNWRMAAKSYRAAVNRMVQCIGYQPQRVDRSPMNFDVEVEIYVPQENEHGILDGYNLIKYSELRDMFGNNTI